MNLYQKLKKVKNKKSTQQSIHFLNLYDDGLMEVEKGVYSKTFAFEDINYKIANQSDQEDIFIQYKEFLNSLDSDAHLQVTINNNYIDKNDFEKLLLIENKDDIYKDYRNEFNSIIKKQIQEGSNETKKEKYFTLTIKAKDKKAAESSFMKFEIKLLNDLRRLGSKGRVLNKLEKLSILNNFFNSNDKLYFDNAKNSKQGIGDKDLIAPECFVFKDNHIKIGDRFAQVLFLKDLPSNLGDEFFTSITDFDFQMMATINIDVVEPEEALKIVNRKITAIKQEIIEKSKSAVRSGYNPEFISEVTKESLEDAKDLFNDLKNNDQKMFLVTLTLVHIADTLEELDQQTKHIQSEAQKHICKIGKLILQQEDGLNSTLPYGVTKINARRTLTSESTTIFLPFKAQELIDPNGFYYGLSAVSYNLLMLDRNKLKNKNGFILGTPGSGKSFAAKKEMINAILKTGDDVLVIDPEREYTELARKMNGEVIEISPHSNNYINPLDMDKDYSDEEDPLIMKADFILSLCDLIVGGNMGLSPEQKSIIGRCVTSVYHDYILSGYDKAKTPTLLDFYDVLNNEDEAQAKQIALSLELYVKGLLSVFANKTNVDINNRFVVFDIKDLGKQLKNIGLLICLDFVWNRMIENRKKGKRTWIYFDEAHILFKNDYSANFLYELYKRARKWDGIPTGITQNVEELLDSEYARKMLSNSEFIMLLNQAPLDREILADLLKISESQLNFVTNRPPGQGLISYSGIILPYIDHFPTNTELYKCMTTKPEEKK